MVDTGHVLIAAAGEGKILSVKGLPVEGLGSYWIRVVDASKNKRHLDSRGGEGFQEGVGSGYIQILVGDRDQPVGWRWREDTKIHMTDIHIGRMLPNCTRPRSRSL
jgi:hypothetical protein